MRHSDRIIDTCYKVLQTNPPRPRVINSEGFSQMGSGKVYGKSSPIPMHENIDEQVSHHKSKATKYRQHRVRWSGG